MDIAIITGASAGLGQAFFRSVVRRYPKLDQIWLIARRADRLQQLAQDSPVPVECLPLDLTQDGSYQAISERLAAEQPRVRILINNAGLGQLDDMVDSDVATQVRMVDVNCRGLTAVTTAVLPYMPKDSFVIQVASIAAFAPNARMTVYSSTKAYVLSLARGLRMEMKSRGVNVLALCPGPMSTEFLEKADITAGKSKQFDTLPYSDPEAVADGAVVRAARGKAIYTPRAFYRFYHFVSKVMPTSLVMKMCRT